MENQLKDWLEEQTELVTDRRNQTEVDRVLLQGRQEALQAVLNRITEIENESNKPSGETEEVKPTPVTAAK